VSRPYAPILTERLQIVLPDIDDAPRQLAYFEANREHFAPWDPARDAAFFTLERMEGWIRDNRDAAARGVGFHFILQRRGESGGAYVGTIGLSNVVYGVFRAAHLGYSLDRSCVGLGYMHEALTAVIAYAFGPLDLHRLMANYQPINERSAEVLRKLGFSIEGLARNYLFLAGQWRDHVLTSLVRAETGVNETIIAR
jgi:ribosomal-protein-alanine N-acetyltransferase